MFEKMDADGSGELDTVEFQVIVRAHGLMIS